MYSGIELFNYSSSWDDDEFNRPVNKYCPKATPTYIIPKNKDEDYSNALVAKEKELQSILDEREKITRTMKKFVVEKNYVEIGKAQKKIAFLNFKYEKLNEKKIDAWFYAGPPPKAQIVLDYDIPKKSHYTVADIVRIANDISRLFGNEEIDKIRITDKLRQAITNTRIFPQCMNIAGYETKDILFKGIHYNIQKENMNVVTAIKDALDIFSNHRQYSIELYKELLRNCDACEYARRYSSEKEKIAQQRPIAATQCITEQFGKSGSLDIFYKELENEIFKQSQLKKQKTPQKIFKARGSETIYEKLYKLCAEKISSKNDDVFLWRYTKIYQVRK